LRGQRREEGIRAAATPDEALNSVGLPVIANHGKFPFDGVLWLGWLVRGFVCLPRGLCVPGFPPCSTEMRCCKPTADIGRRQQNAAAVHQSGTRMPLQSPEGVELQASVSAWPCGIDELKVAAHTPPHLK